MSNQGPPPLRLVKTWQAAEDYAAEYVAWLGWEDARATRRSGDDGIDVLGRNAAGTAVAQVKMEGRPVEARIVREARGAGVPVEATTVMIFALAGFTSAAISWADRADVALFEFAFDGAVTPVNPVAARLLSRGAQVRREGIAHDVEPPRGRARPAGAAGELTPHDLAVLSFVEQWEREDRMSPGVQLYDASFDHLPGLPQRYVLRALPTLRRFLDLSVQRERGTAVACTIYAIKPAGVKALLAWGRHVQQWRLD